MTTKFSDRPSDTAGETKKQARPVTVLKAGFDESKVVMPEKYKVTTLGKHDIRELDYAERHGKE